MYEKLWEEGATVDQGREIIMSRLSMIKNKHCSNGEFGKRLSVFTNHYNNNDIPISFLPRVGYDFLLSDMGLELGLPPKPDDLGLDVIFQLYYDRKMAKTSTIIPGTASRLFQHLINNKGLSRAEAATAAVRAFSVPENPTTGRPTRIRLAKGARRRDFPSQIEEELKKRSRTLRQFKGLVSPSRKWALGADIYSKFMQRLPRFVAQIWRDELLTEKPCALRKKYEGDSKDVLNFFGLLEECWPPGELTFECDEGTYEITIIQMQDGSGVVKFPPVPNRPVNSDGLLEEWRSGLAVNPIFTSCVIGIWC